MGLGALVLVLAGVLATKANKKFLVIQTAYYLVGGTTYATAIGACSGQLLFKTASSGTVATVDSKRMYYYTTTSPFFKTLYVK